MSESKQHPHFPLSAPASTPTTNGQRNSPLQLMSLYLDPPTSNMFLLSTTCFKSDQLKLFLEPSKVGEEFREPRLVCDGGAQIVTLVCCLVWVWSAVAVGCGVSSTQLPHANSPLVTTPGPARLVVVPVIIIKRRSGIPAEESFGGEIRTNHPYYGRPRRLSFIPSAVHVVCRLLLSPLSACQCTPPSDASKTLFALRSP